MIALLLLVLAADSLHVGFRAVIGPPRSCLTCRGCPDSVKVMGHPAQRWLHWEGYTLAPWRVIEDSVRVAQGDTVRREWTTGAPGGTGAAGDRWLWRAGFSVWENWRGPLWLRVAGDSMWADTLRSYRAPCRKRAVFSLPAPPKP